MGFRTRQLKRERKVGQPEICRNGWRRCKDESGNTYYTRPRYPGAPRPKGAQVTTPHPDKYLRAKGFRLDWRFTILLVISAGVIMAGMHICA